ncbi:prepilin-type N-terminal cleavage/methylation domain-containing protein [Sphingomonas profundi]|uniref:prepilin-type N-terminal cleavage/methylation domain-containing protein n=1 Tax=Alterirhizorhabdus profundi TaxID=2681549 RepID=UPI0012E8DBA1|nr:prepilin-type N-terminal cleavage/methylation domain-containing protein [Sphingomonas profundi]
MRAAGRHERGMTLVEMLVVLAIIGVMAGATVLGMGSAARGANIESEARRLADRVQLAADDTMIGDRPLALAWDAKGYGFLAWDGAGWRAGEGEAFARHALPAGITLALSAAVSGPARGPVPLGLDGGGMPFVARLASATARWTIAYDGLTVSASPAPRS